MLALGGKKSLELLSIVVPCFNEEATIPIFFKTVERIRGQIQADIEYCFVDDGSKDGTLAILRALRQKSDVVHYISFSRNFGKEAALYAGLQMAKGDYIVTMDVDLQDPPALLAKMYELLQSEDWDCVATKRGDRKGEPKIRSFLSDSFYKVINKMSKTEIVNGARDFRMMKRTMVDAVLSMSEYNRFSKGLFGWVGFRTKWFAFENVERVAGETKWSFWKLLLYAVDGIVAFSTVPLIVSTMFGILSCLASFVGILFVVIRKLIIGDPIQGWASTICIILLMGGIQLLCTGILGQYLAKTYLETKKRPVYIIDELKLRGGVDH